MQVTRVFRSGPMVALLACLTAFSGAEAQAKSFIFKNPTFGWSIVFSSAWTLDAKDRSFVQLIREDNSALCGIQSLKVPFKSVTEFSAVLQLGSAKMLRPGMTAVEKSQKAIKTGSGEAGQQIIVALVPGGMSQRAYFLRDGVGYLIDCETYAEDFKALSREFTTMQKSFSFK